MSYRDPETGKMFEDIEAAMEHFCYESRRECGGCNFNNKPCRKNWIHDHPTEAARLMGYEVIEDTPTEKLVKQKPRLAEVLGVEEDEIWDYPGLYGPYRVHNGVREFEYENVWRSCANEGALTEIINHPERIIRAPRLTEAELERCRVYGAKWVSKDPCSTITVELWEEKPRLDSNVYISNTKEYLVRAKDRFFPSVRPGDCINVEEVETCG